jgi:hypothetical protein
MQSFVIVLPTQVCTTEKTERDINKVPCSGLKRRSAYGMLHVTLYQMLPAFASCLDAWNAALRQGDAHPTFLATSDGGGETERMECSREGLIAWGETGG